MRRSTGQRSYASLVLKLLVLVVPCALRVSAQTTSTPSLTIIQSPTQSLITASPGNEISPTTTTVTAQSTAAPAQPYNNSVQVIIEFSQISWINQFLDKTSQPYKALEHNVSKAVLEALTADGSRGKVEVLEFKPGSVLAFLNVSTYEVDDKVKTLLQSKMKNGTIGDFSVAPTLFSGSLFVVELKVKADCNDSLDDKGFRAKASLLSAVENELPNSMATIKKISCPKPGNVTMVTMRVQIERPNTTNPDEELEQLKDEVKSGKVGNVSVIPDWQAYNPGEKLFTASFDLKDASDEKNASAYLEAEIRKLFRNDTNFENVTVEIKDNKTAIVKIRMKIAAPDEPKKALKPLQDSVKNGSVGSAQVNKGSYRAFVNPNTVTQRVFEVHFWQNVSNCNVSTVNDSRYLTAQQVAVNFINKLKAYKYFIAARQKSLECVDNDTNVYAVFVVYLKPDAPEKRVQLNRFLLLCKADAAIYKHGLKLVDITPSQPNKNPPWTHWVCNKPKPTVTTPTEITTTTTPTPTPLPVPKLYVKLKLGMTWGEFCSKLEHSLRQKIAWNLYDKNGARVSPDRIIFINVERNCNDPAKKDEQAEVWFYVSKKSGSKDLHRCLTLKAYRLFKMFLENGNTKHLGPDFEGKLIHVDLVGEDAPKYKTREDSGKLSTLAIILIAVAGAVGLLLLTMACCCLFCCGARRRRKNDDQSHKLHLVHIVDGDGTEGKGNKDKGKKKKGANENDGNDKDKEGKRKKDKDRNKKDDGDRVINYENNAYGTAKDDGYTELNSNTLKSAPVIVTSPAPVTDKTNEGNKLGQASDSASSTPGGSRRGSSSNDGEGQGGGGLRHIDPEFKDRERRRSSVHSLIDDEDIPLTHKTGTVGIVALALRNRNEKKKEAEFKNLDKDVPDEEVKYPASTQAKNRSPDVLPAPKTRVKLSSNPDYINANWIRDHQGKKCYIATQHPLHETAEDFWRMTWEQQADMVVMVNEEEKEKPAEFMDYLPKGEGSTKSFGSIDITVKQIVKKADYTLTVLNLAVSKKLASSREVSHMRFTSWKERAMPNVALFVGFVTATREVRRKKGDSRAPTIVHCSDGLGFSGVYVAVDIGIKSHEESKTSVVDVFELSKNLRRDRHGIVCSLDHYNFIYQALYEYTVNYDESAESEKL